MSPVSAERDRAAGGVCRCCGGLVWGVVRAGEEAEEVMRYGRGRLSRRFAEDGAICPLHALQLRSWRIGR